MLLFMAITLVHTYDICILNQLAVWLLNLVCISLGVPFIVFQLVRLGYIQAYNLQSWSDIANNVILNQDADEFTQNYAMPAGQNISTTRRDQCIDHGCFVGDSWLERNLVGFNRGPMLSFIQSAAETISHLTINVH